jgi:CRP-like cAMP-binding protein
MAKAQSDPKPDLSGVQFFRGIREDGIADIIERSRTAKFGAEEYLFFQGDPANVFYIVVEGRIKLTQVNEEGVQVILSYPGPGEAFGIIAVLREMAFPVSAEAVADTECLAWDEGTLKQMILAYPQLGLNAIQILSKFILDFQDRIKELSSERVEQRVARALLRLVEKQPDETEEPLVINFKLTRQDVAELSGATLFTISRILSAWEREGLLADDAQQITVLDPARLRQLAAGADEGET